MKGELRDDDVLTWRGLRFFVKGDVLYISRKEAPFLRLWANPFHNDEMRFVKDGLDVEMYDPDSDEIQATLRVDGGSHELWLENTVIHSWEASGD